MATTAVTAFLRLAQCWGRAMLGRHPGRAADEAERLIVTNLMHPVRSDVATWFALLAQMRLAADALDAAAAALDHAENLQHRYGQRAAEALILLIRAEFTLATGDRDAARSLAQRARAVAARAEAFLFQRRADRFITGLIGAPAVAGERPPILQSPSTRGS